MHLELSPAQRELQRTFREYLARLVTPELEDALYREDTSTFREAVAQIGRDGWLGIGWPVEVGGRGGSVSDRFIIFDEAARARAPFPFVSLNTVAPVLLRLGTEEQKRDILPRLLAGELHVALGYSEAEAGTDLAALKTRAVRDGDAYVINGAKVFTSHAHYADLIWLAAKTDLSSQPHRGISVFLIPSGTPGITVVPMRTIADRTNATFYDDVRVSADCLVGAENGGWSVMTAQLNLERIAMAASGPLERVYASVVAWARDTPGAGGGNVIDEPWVQMTLARVYSKIEALRLLAWNGVWKAEAGVLTGADAAAVKVYGTESCVEAYRLLSGVMGESAIFEPGYSGTPAEGLIERDYGRALMKTFGGGTNEVQRELIATLALGVPKSPRHLG